MNQPRARKLMAKRAGVGRKEFPTSPVDCFLILEACLVLLTQTTQPRPHETAIGSPVAVSFFSGFSRRIPLICLQNGK
jgi:hypothetical protein